MILLPESVTLKDGKECKLVFNGKSYDFCNVGSLTVLDDGSSVGVELYGETPSSISFSLNTKLRDFIAITRQSIAKFNWCYNSVYVGEKKEEECQSLEFTYPIIEKENMDCWTYYYTSRDTNGESLANTVTILGLTNDDKYLAIYTLSSGDTISYIDKGFKVVSYVYGNERSWILAYSISNDPYDAINNAIKGLRDHTNTKLRIEKERPKFLDYIGWCSWNAFLGNVNEEGVLNTVRDLVAKGVPIGWVLVDDGWEVIDERTRAQKQIAPNTRKFPHGFRFLIQSLKSLGVRYVGLWHTLNIYWGGIDEEFVREVGIRGEKVIYDQMYPPSDFSSALAFYSTFHKKLRNEGLDFVKVDNQISIERYNGNIPRKATSIQSALQISSIINGLDVLNCMAMIPESYCNMFNTNIMRNSMDYIPLWKEGGKLHLALNAYNSLFFSGISWLDFDMFSTYDPLAKAHLILRVFSGGPIYITDRDISKTNVELLKRVILPNGEVVKVDFPALLTRDLLFSNILKENKSLKIASKVKGVPAISICNLKDKNVSETLYLKHLPYTLDFKPIVYYKVFKEEGGLLREDKIDLELNEDDCEIVILSLPGIIGIKEYLLPPYPIVEGKPIVSGTLIKVDERGIITFERTNGYRYL